MTLAISGKMEEDFGKFKDFKTDRTSYFLELEANV